MLTRIILIIFYYSFYLLFPFLGFLFWKLFQNKKISIEIIILIIISLVLIWSRFIEPSNVITRKYDFSIQKENLSSKEIKVLIISDLHLGAYNNDFFLKRIVKKINKINPDIVVIPGDFSYYLNSDNIHLTFSELKNIKAIKFAVLGNHDYGKGEKDISQKLTSNLEMIGVLMLDNKTKTIEINNSIIRIVGLEDIWVGSPNYSILEKNNFDEQIDLSLLIAHNPDTIYNIKDYCSVEKECFKSDLMISGHTHAGQIRLPWFYKYVIPSAHGFNKGFYNVFETDIFVTPGIGNVVLPLRLFNFPEISLINLKY
ncbi:MAG TPA: metallophosphoesterase [bacterium]|nr:metallophosphoesterase [bacterium]